MHEISSIELRQVGSKENEAAPLKDEAVWIRVNGFPLDDVFQEIVSWDWSGDLLNAAELHDELNNALRPGTHAYEHGVLIGCLANEQGVTIHIRVHVFRDDKYIIWQDFYDETGHADFSHLFFRFDRTEYDTAMGKLLGMVRVRE